MKVMGTSLNPEYAVASNQPRFRRDEQGRRLAPLSQLNTFAGRMLAQQQTMQTSSYSEGISRSVNPEDVRKQVNHQCRSASIRSNSTSFDRPYRERTSKPLPEQKPTDVGIKGQIHVVSDRDRLTSQRLLTEPSQLFGMVRGNPHNEDNAAAKKTIAPARCPECKQSSSKLGQSVASNRVCGTCRRFVPVRVTALRQESLPKPQEHVDLTPTPTFESLSGLNCTTCLRVPRTLQKEYLAFFPPCIVCGFMTDLTLTRLVDNEGEIPGLLDSRGKIRCHPSKDLQDWCFAQVKLSHNVSRKDSEHSLAESIKSVSSAALRRTHATRRTFRRGLRSGMAEEGMTQHAGLVPVKQWREEGARYSKRFSFMPLDKSNAYTPSTIAQSSRYPTANEQYESEGHCKDSAADHQPMRESSKDLPALNFPSYGRTATTKRQNGSAGQG